tara:strand:+ start:99 stop:476 length:378 start_codon:yes stop_codon:yes gene_type:complete
LIKEHELRLREIDFGAAVPIEGYGEGFFRIAGQAVRAPLMVNKKGAKPWGGYEDFASLKAFCEDVDVLLVGTGQEISHIPPSFRSILEQAGVGIEVMSSLSACRTYNVLLSEERRVAAALFAVEC